MELSIAAGLAGVFLEAAAAGGENQTVNIVINNMQTIAAIGARDNPYAFLLIISASLCGLSPVLISNNT